jgi:hypothetical protein
MFLIRLFLFRSIRIVPLLLVAALAPPILFAANNPVPYIDIVSPVSVHPGSTSVTLTVLGAGFVSTSVVEWNSISLTTTFVSGQKLTAAVPDSFVAAVGLGSINVVNPTSRISNVVYFPVASAEAGTTFPSTPSSTVTVGNGPTGVVTADFNGDGRLDLAVANMTDGTVTILLGNGDGTFTQKSTLTAGSGANWLAVGDFNEDGKQDLAVANSGSTGIGGVTILLGNGDGTFTTGASLTTGDGPFAIVTADFNKDGHLDLAVSNANSDTVTVLLGTGSGTFSFASTPAAGTMPQVIVVGDFNEDGKLDLAVSNESDNTVSVLLGNGNGTFQTQSAISSGGTSGFPIGLIAADFNGDGHLDLAAVNASDVGILLGSGTGTFTLHSDPSTGSTFLISGVTGDYNGDGKLDIVVADQVSGQAFFLPGNGDGTFGSIVTFTVGSGAYDVATADFNGDGALDLAITNSTSTNISIFLQQLPVSLAPTSLAFGNQGVGSTSSPAKTVTLTNHSGSSLSISSITFTGADSGDFARPGGTCSTSVAVPNNSTCTMTVNFTPGAAGARTATLTITDGAGNSPQTLGLTGTGVVSAPTIAKTFGAATIPLNGSTTLSFTITNPIANVTSLTGVAFSDSFPAGLLISTPNGLTGSCGGGTITATAGVGSLSLSGATIAASGSCTFGVNVVGISAGAQANTTGTVSSNESGAGATSNTATVTVLGPPTITKSFGAASIPLNGSTTLTFTVSNTNSGTSLTSVGFTDTLPSGLVVATPNGLSGPCGSGTITATAASASVSLSAATLAASSSCNFTVNVTGTTAGAQSNTTGAVTSTNGGTGGTASANLAVVAPPSISKAFGASGIALNGTTSLSFTVTNPSANTVSLTGVAFTDTLPLGILVATPNGLTGSCGGGTITSTAGSAGVSLSAATLATSASCVFSVNVTGTSAGSYTNTTNAVTSTNGGTGNTATANLSVASAPMIAKSFGAATIPLNGSTSLSFTITNPIANTSSLTGVAFTDSLPSGLVVATPSGLSGSCGGGTITATAGSSSASLSGATLAASGSCVFSVNVTGTTAGAKNNSVSVTSTTAGSGNTSNASVTVVAPPTITKSFGAATVPLNGSTTLTFTVSNTNAGSSLTGVGFTDTFPSGLVVATPNGLTGSCGGGTITATQGTASVILSAATLAATSSCNFSVNVTGTTAGSQSNTTGALTSTNGGTGGTASANLAVLAPPSISKSFGVSNIPPSGTTSLTFTITNPAANTAALTGVAFTDTLPANIFVATPNGLTGSCGGGTITAIAASGSASLAGATLATNSSCNFSVNVTGSTNGNFTNVTASVTSTNGGTGNTASASLAVNSSASITSASNTTFSVGSAGSFTITSTGSPVPSFTETGALPPGVTFTDNGNGTATLSGTPAALSGGAYPIVITAHNGAGSDSVQNFTLTVDQSAAIISASTTSFLVGSVGSFAVTTSGRPAPSITKTGALPNGVTFTDNGNGTATLSGTPAASTGGSYPITFTAHNGIGSDAVQSFTLTVDQAAAITSTSAASFTFGLPGSFSITTTGKPTPALSETGTLPPGVTFTDNGNGTATLSGTPAPGSGGIYTFTITAHNGVGSDTTQTFTFTIAKATPLLAWAAPAAITYGAALSPTQLDATANVPGAFLYSPASGAVLVAGSQTLSVTFTPTDTTDYSNLSANVTLTVTKGTPAIIWAAPSAIVYGTAIGSAQLDATASTAGIFVYTPAAGVILGAGPQTLSVAFTATDASDYLAATAQTSLVVNFASTTTSVSVLPISAGIGASVTFTATVTSSAATPTGTVTIFDGAAALDTLPLASGVATFTTSTLAAGPHSITCSYSGSANFSPSISSAVIETVSTPGFSVASSSGSAVTQPGQPVNIPITLTPQGGFTGQVTFSVTGLPPNSSAVFHPAVLTLGSGPAADTLTILISPQFPYLSRNRGSRPVVLSAAASWLPLVGLTLCGAGLARRRNRKFGVWLLLFAVASAAAALGGCASARSFQNSGTPAGTYQLLITASSANTSHATTITLTVR